MSSYLGKRCKNSILSIMEKKEKKEKISMVTCYDATFARLIDEAPIDMVLVGDSLGNVIMGQEDTTKVTMDDMIYHSRVVSSQLRYPMLCVDMPFMSYQISIEQTLKNAARLVQEGGAQCVKLEGGLEIIPQVKALVKSGIPVVGHLGLTPQRIHVLGGFKVQGRNERQKRELLESAIELEKAGAFAMVLELIPADLAEEITRSVNIPTIGIGAGPSCDGQVLVLYDLLGINLDFKPKFLKHYARLGEQIHKALKEFNDEVKSGVFPSRDHSFE